MPSSLPPVPEDPLAKLIGARVPSEVVPDVSYRIVWPLGEGGMSVVFYALRMSADGEVPVVMKMLRPAFVWQAGPMAALIVKKEAIALGRLNERVPPTPFVVRFIDTGTISLQYGTAPVEVPWVVVEYVHGGAEGTTLSQRVDHSMRSVGSAFDPVRAAHSVECLTSGLSAVHEVGVIHRDLKPDNVLCCGFGDGEIFKLADFGVARPAGVATFTGAVMGTPGFVAPELTMGDSNAVGPWSDIFSLGSLIFFLLTGEEYLPSRTPADSLVLALRHARRSILDTPGLSPEFRAQEQACRSIDFALAAATAGKIDGRPQRADALAAMLLPWLRVESTRSSLVVRRLSHLLADDDEDDSPTGVTRWTWHTMRSPSREKSLVIRNVAWDGDGRCMAVTVAGLAFWNGSTWTIVNPSGLPDPRGIRFVQRVAAGQWLIGWEDATFATYTTDGVGAVQRLPGGPLDRYERVSGDLNDLAVLVGTDSSGTLTLCAASGRRWLKPLPLHEMAVLSSLARVEDARWLLAGRGQDGRGYTALYSPLDWNVERLDCPNVRAYLSCAGHAERGIGVCTGAEGAVVIREGGKATCEVVDGAHDLSAAGIDAAGRMWTACAGKIWVRRPGASRAMEGTVRWDCIWKDASWSVPIVSLFTELGGVIGMTADGGVIEGRSLRPTLVDNEETK